MHDKCKKCSERMANVHRLHSGWWNRTVVHLDDEDAITEWTHGAVTEEPAKGSLPGPWVGQTTPHFVGSGRQDQAGC